MLVDGNATTDETAPRVTADGNGHVYRRQAGSMLAAQQSLQCQ